MPAIPPHNTATVDTTWDGPAAEAAIPNDAGESVFRREYAWVSGDGDPDTKAAYKFPHHEVTDGSPGAANLNGVRNGLSRLPQANIPDGDRSGVEAHLRNHMPAEDQAAYDEASRFGPAVYREGAGWQPLAGRIGRVEREDDAGPRRRDFALSVRADGEPDSREVSGTAVTYTERNSYWEVFVPGSLAASMAAKSDRKPLVMGYGHTDPIGRWTDFEETLEGLQVRGKVSDTALGNDALTLVRDGALTGLSIGFYPGREVFAEADQEMIFDTPLGEARYQFDGPTFYITEADVVEASIVMAPADDEARLNARRRALRSLPDTGEADRSELLEAMRYYANDEGDGLDLAERQAIVMRLASALDGAEARSQFSVAIPEAFGEASMTLPLGGSWSSSGNATGWTGMQPEPPIRSALTDLLEVGIESMADDSADALTDLLAEASGLDPFEVDAILAGDTEAVSPSRDALIAFADVLGLPADDVIAAAESDGWILAGEDDDTTTAAALAELRESIVALNAKVRPTD